MWFTFFAQCFISTAAVLSPISSHGPSMRKRQQREAFSWYWSKFHNLCHSHEKQVLFVSHPFSYVSKCLVSPLWLFYKKKNHLPLSCQKSGLFSWKTIDTLCLVYEIQIVFQVWRSQSQDLSGRRICIEGGVLRFWKRLQVLVKNGKAYEKKSTS